MSSLLRLVIAGVFVGCSSSGSADPAPTGEPDAAADAGPSASGIGWQSCAAEFTADPSGHGCRDVVAKACGVGQRQQLGNASCIDVAKASCAAGFASDGWGCKETLPATACTGATRETLGSATCTPIDDCNAAFPPAGATIFVDPNAVVDATHFKTIGAAITAAPAGATIAIAAGTYTESLAATKSIHLIGKCASQVSIASSGAATSGIVASNAADVTVEDVSFTGHLDGAASSGNATLTLRKVVIDGSRSRGVSVGSAHVVVEGSVIRNSASHGIEAVVGSQLTVRDSALRANTETGIKTAGNGTELVLERTAVMATKPTASGFGLGVIVRDGAKGTISASAILDNHEAGLLVYGASSAATLTDSVIARTVASTETVYGRGILLDAGRVTVVRSTLRENQESALVAERAGTATLTDSVFRATTTNTEGHDGEGMTAITGGIIDGTSVAIVDMAGAGASAVGAGSKLTLTGSIVTGTHGDDDGERGFGVSLETGGAAELHDVAVVENRNAGIGAVDDGTSIAADHVLVLRTKPGPKDTHGRGFVLDLGAQGALTKSVVGDNLDIAIQVRSPKTKLTMDEVVVRGTAPQKSDGAHGRGLEAGSGGTVIARHVTFDANHGTAVFSSAAGSSVSLQDIWVAGTLGDKDGAGRALTAQSGGVLSVERSVVSSSVQIGVAATAGGVLSMKSSLVEGTALGNDQFGHGVLVYDGSLATLADVTIQGSAGAGLVFDSARGTVSACKVIGNAVGVFAQNGSAIEEAAEVPDDPADNQVVVSASTSFQDNGVKIGSGAVVLPAPLE